MQTALNLEKLRRATTSNCGGAVAIGAGARGGCDGFRARSGGAVRGGACSGSGGAVRAERLGGAVQTFGAPASRVGGVVICGHFQVENLLQTVRLMVLTCASIEYIIWVQIKTQKETLSWTKTKCGTDF